MTIDLSSDRSPDEDDERRKRLHDLHSSIRAISIYADLIAQETNGIAQVPDIVAHYCAAIANNIEDLSAQLTELGPVGDEIVLGTS